MLRSGVQQQRVHHVVALLVLQALHVHGLRAPASVRKSANLQGKLESFEENVAQFARGAGTVIVDGDNVRGKSGFAVSHMELIRAASLWGNQRGLEGRLVVCIDHGSAADAWYLSELGLAVCFAGPVGTADDLIARAVPCFANAIVITADAGLAKRCRSAGRGRLQVIAPQPFLASLARACAASDEARSPELGELGGGELLLSEALGLLRPPAREALRVEAEASTAGDDAALIKAAEGEMSGEMSGKMSGEMSGEMAEMPERSLLALEAEMEARSALIKAERRLSALPPCNRTRVFEWRLQPCVLEPATPCVRGCGLMCCTHPNPNHNPNPNLTRQAGGARQQAVSAAQGSEGGAEQP